MRDDPVDTVTPGGPHAPLRARGAGGTGVGADDVGRTGRHQDEHRHGPTATASPRATLALGAGLVAALAAYAVLAADVVRGGALSAFDDDVAGWVARSMPAWAEWLARPFTWVGGTLGMTLVVAVSALVLVRRRRPGDAVLLVGAVLAAQLLVQSAKPGYGRPRPDAGAAIPLPGSFSFPSGHAATGVAVLGLLGLLVAAPAGGRGRRAAACAVGVALGVAIGASRVVLNVHFVTDVLAGWAMGLAVAAAGLLAAPRLRAWVAARGG